LAFIADVVGTIAAALSESTARERRLRIRVVRLERVD
jgi:hypothetical protein